MILPNDKFSKLMKLIDGLIDGQRRLWSVLNANFGDSQDWYSPAEFAARINRKPFTVRSWCRNKRLVARKRVTGRGNACEWEVPSSELQRYLNHGLLPIVPEVQKTKC